MTTALASLAIRGNPAIERQRRKQAAKARARRAAEKAAWEAAWLAGPPQRATVEGWRPTELAERLLGEGGTTR